MRLAVLTLLLGGCDFSASTTIIGDSTPFDSSDNGDDSADSSDSPSDSGDSFGIDDSVADTALPSDRDDDGDGYTENQGDCLDSDRAVYPGVEDGCDGVDSDCDGIVDDDASGDGYEPNDTTPYNLGSLEEDPEVSLAAWLNNDDDVDRYQFTIVDDALDFFTLTIEVSDIPNDATYLVSFNRLSSDGDAEIGLIEEQFASGTATFTYSDTSAYEDGGDYEIVVESIAGASCAHGYLLAVAQ